MYLVKTPKLVKPLFKDLLWKVDTDKQEIFLTFDDGPTPQVTTWVLSQLKEYNAKATFFCIGDKASKYPKILEQIKSNGHSIGNHTHNHLNGWKTNNISYFENVSKCEKVFQANYFRPPYGKATKSQINYLKTKYTIVMWDVLSGDFDANCSAEKCKQNVINNTSKGSIIVFHDSEKALEKLQVALPATLMHFTEKGYKFSALS